MPRKNCTVIDASWKRTYADVAKTDIKSNHHHQSSNVQPEKKELAAKIMIKLPKGQDLVETDRVVRQAIRGLERRPKINL